MNIKQAPNKYHPQWDISLALGKSGEDYLCQVLETVNFEASFEVKYDAMTSKTGNVYVEFAQTDRKTGAWKWSGISLTEATYFTFIFAGGTILTVPMDLLKQVVRKHLVPLSFLQEHGAGKSSLMDAFKRSGKSLKACVDSDKMTVGIVLNASALLVELIEAGAGTGLPSPQEASLSPSESPKAERTQTHHEPQNSLDKGLGAIYGALRA